MKRAAIAAWALALAAALPAQGMGDIAAKALASNPQILSLRQALADLRAEAPSLLTIDQAKLSLSSSYNTAAQTGALGASASLSLPIVPQASLGASYDLVKGSGSLDLSIQPFAKGKDAEAWADSVALKERELASEEAKLRSSAESFYVSMYQAQRKLAIASARLKLAEQAYKAATDSYEGGLLSYKEHRDSVQSYQSALQNYLKAERDLVGVKKTGLSLLGDARVMEGAEAWELSEDELSALIAEAKAGLGKAEDARSYELYQLESSLASLVREQEATWAWQPSVSLSAKTGLDFKSLNLGLSFSLSFDQFKFDEKSELDESIALKRQEIARKKIDIGYAVRQLELQAETQEEGLKVQALSAALAEASYAESEARFAAGGIDSSELEASRLDLEEARLSLIQSYADLLATYRSLELYYPTRSTPSSTPSSPPSSTPSSTQGGK